MGRSSEAKNPKNPKKVKCDGPTDGPTKRVVESRITRLKIRGRYKQYREVNIAELGKEASKNEISEFSYPLSRGPNTDTKSNFDKAWSYLVDFYYHYSLNSFKIFYHVKNLRFYRVLYKRSLWPNKDAVSICRLLVVSLKYADFKSAFNFCVR